MSYILKIMQLHSGYHSKCYRAGTSKIQKQSNCSTDFMYKKVVFNITGSCYKQNLKKCLVTSHLRVAILTGNSLTGCVYQNLT